MQARAGSKITLGQNAPLHISYNAGLQALQLGKYATALRCFQVSLADVLMPWLCFMMLLLCLDQW